MTIGTFELFGPTSRGAAIGVGDPKETWAITMVVYAVVTHLHLVKRGGGYMVA